MADTNDSPPNSPTGRRRSSFTGQTFAELFGGRTRPSIASDNTGTGNSPPTASSITSAAAQAQRRRMSMTAMGISGSPAQANSFSGNFGRRDSISSANSGSIDEPAIEDDVGPIQSTPNTPFARRMSFGARALRDVKNNTNAGGGGTAGGTDKSNGDGYNWADNFRNRAERSSSIASLSGSPLAGNHVRAKSVATMQPPAQEMPKPKAGPDHIEERILRGQFGDAF